jgi:PTS system N-acetylgalactosamine-specific IIC component
MDYNIVQIVLIFAVTFIVAIDQFNFLESLYQPIVTGMVVGLILGDVTTGLIVGGTYQLMTIGNMPVGGAQPPNAVIGGIMAAILAITLKLEPNAAVGMAVPFSLLGQYGVTLIFTIMSPVMSVADRYANEANPKGIERINYLAMAALGTIFGLVVVLFFIGGDTFGQTIADAIPTWLMGGLSAAGGMMRFVGFAILLKVMISGELWGFYFMGFALAIVVSSIEALASPALIILALVGFGFAFWDFQIHTKIADGAGNLAGGSDGDGI